MGEPEKCVLVPLVFVMTSAFLAMSPPVLVGGQQPQRGPGRDGPGGTVAAETLQVPRVAADQPSPGGHSKKDGKNGDKNTVKKKNLICPDNTGNCANNQKDWEAIQALHHLIDDDRNGNVDQSESDEFLRDELQYTDGFERHNIFHGNDELISVDDLWKSWKQSEVYNWTTNDVVEWLEHYVELPQYSSNFEANSVSGPSLPRLATNYQHYLSGVLGIKNPVHKQKLSLKAMDVVLFGPPKKGHSYLKDLILIASLIIAVGGCWFAYLQHRYSQRHVKRMMKDWDTLQKAEETLKELQEKLDRAQQEQMHISKEKSSLEEKFHDEIEMAKNEAERLKSAREGSMEEISRLKLAEEELMQVRAALKKAEKEIEIRQWLSAPSELQAWLQMTYEIELQHHNTKRKVAETQLIEAREWCEKLRKKRNTFMGSLRIAHSGSIDEVDHRILSARAALEEVRQDLQERLQRWRAIEMICGFSVMKNPGLVALCQMLHSEKNLGAKQSSTMFSHLDVDEADEDIPPVYTGPSGASLYNISVPNGMHRSVLKGFSSTLKARDPPPIMGLRKRTSSLNHHSFDGTLSNANHSSGGSQASPDSEVSFHLGESLLTTQDDVLLSTVQGTTQTTNLVAGKTEVNTLVESKSVSHFIAVPPVESEQVKHKDSITSSTSECSLSELERSRQADAGRYRLSLHSALEEVSDTESMGSGGDDKKKNKKKKILPKLFRKNGDLKKK